MSQLPILGYKRHSPPVLKDKLGARDAVLSARKSGSVPPEEKYLTGELQRIENSLDTNNQQTRTVNDGVVEVKQTVIDLTETVETNASTTSAAITTEATLRVSADEALTQLNTDLTATVATNASTGAAALATEQTTRATADSALSSSLATLSATVSTGDTSNAAAITAEQTARANADESLTLISNTQRALFGATVSDNWDSTVEYTGSTTVVGSNTVGTGDDVVYGGFIYRCKLTHTNQVPPNTLYWDRVDTVDAKVSAAVLIESTARSTADSAQAATSTALSGRVSTLENDTTDADAIAVNAADIVDTNELIVSNESATAERFELTAARFGITVADTYDNARTYQVGEEAIYSTILYRCKAITSGNLPTNTLYWDFQQLVPAAISAAVQTETTARTTADTALANTSKAISGRVTTLENDTTDAVAIAVNASDIVDIEKVMVTNESATAEKFQLTAARLGITVADTYDSAREYQVGEEAIHSAILYRCTAITTGNVPTDTSYWSFQELVPAAIAAAVGVETAARVAADGTLLTKYGVALNSNGYITGFSQNNDGTTGSFKIIADDFRIIDPSATAGATGDQVFSVINGVVTMNTAHIGNLSIDTGKMVDNAITTVATAGYGTTSGVVVGTTEMTLLTINFTGTGSTAEVVGNVGVGGQPTGLFIQYYLNGTAVSVRNFAYGGVHVFQCTTAVGSNSLVMKGYKLFSSQGNAYVAPAYMRILELKK